MGCDIHCFAEVKKNGNWEKVGSVFKDPSYDWYKENYKELPYYVKEFTDSPYDGRNYALFSMLANVRNHYDIVPISNPKGLPDDISNDVKAEYAIWHDDSHSRSWLTVRELKEYDWKNQVANYNGWLNVDEYKAFTSGEKNFGYAGDVGGRCVIKLSKEQMDRKISQNSFEENLSYYVYCEWTQFYYQDAEFFVDEVIPELESLGEPDDVRIVFWFDS